MSDEERLRERVQGLADATMLIKSLCTGFKVHAEAGGLKVKTLKADSAALHYFVGVCHTLSTLNDPRYAHVERFTMYLVATRGYSEVLKNVEG